MTDLKPEGLWIDPAPGVRLRTPGLAGEAVVHTVGAGGGRGPEDARPEFLEALRHNEMDEDLTIEIRNPRETTESRGSRARGGEDDIALEAPDPGEGWAQVVLYESEDGVLSWHLPEERNAGATTRGSGTLTYTIPREVALEEGGDGQRGILGAVGSKILKVLTFRLVKAGSQWLGDEFARRIEDRYKPHALVRFAPDCYTDARPQELGAGDLAALPAGRALLLVHGTASSAYGAFHNLPPDRFAALHERYGGRVVAFNHPTVATSPVENVKWLADRLAGLGLPRLEVDVLCHSRGGLVGRVLTEQAALAGIADRVDVRNLVMVATPNAGTALADVEHLEHLLNRLTTMLQLVPDNGVTDALDVILAVLKQVASGFFSGLDGLMSMNPDGEFLTETLNTPAQTSATYFAAAANYRPPGGAKLLRVARDRVTDLVFGDVHNDLVVPTEGVFTVPGAGTFPIADPLVFGDADAVDHSGFWTRPELDQRLTAWLPG